MGCTDDRCTLGHAAATTESTDPDTTTEQSGKQPDNWRSTLFEALCDRARREETPVVRKDEDPQRLVLDMANALGTAKIVFLTVVFCLEDRKAAWERTLREVTQDLSGGQMKSVRFVVCSDVDAPSFAFPCTIDLSSQSINVAPAFYTV